MTEQYLSRQQIKQQLADKLRCRAPEVRCSDCWRDGVPIAEVERYTEGLLGIRPSQVPPCPTIAQKSHHLNNLIDLYKES